MRFDPVTGIFRFYEGGGKGSAAPPAPDYAGAANVQAASSKEATTTQNWANRPTINTPWGSQTWGAGSTTDPSTGQAVTDWTQNINLTPQSQQALNDQQQITAGRSGIAKGLMGQVANATATPFNWDGISKVGDLKSAQDDAFTKMSASLQPGRTQQNTDLDTKLANMGLPRNSEAWNRAKTQLQGQWSQEDKGLLAQSLSEGRADIGTEQSQRTAGIAEEAQKRGMSLNELNALLTGQQVNMPAGMSAAPGSTANASQANQALTAAGMQGNYGLTAAQMNAQNNNWGAGIGGVASLAAAFI